MNLLLPVYDSYFRWRARREGIQRIAVSVVVKRDGKLLLLQRSKKDVFPDVFELPGGALEPNETILVGARRELVEETGVRMERALRIDQGPDTTDSSGKRMRRFVVFALTNAQEPRLDPQSHGTFTFSSVEDVHELPMLEDMHSIVESALTMTDK
jgi:ADP-ribose pyrophosphatase YjhB (NUDIX family)